MPIHNADIAAMFTEIADLLEIEGANPFRIRAYRNAARIVAEWPHELRGAVERGEDLTRLPGIGEDLAGKDPRDRHDRQMPCARKAAPDAAADDHGVTAHSRARPEARAHAVA
jgi:hypothetical protein